MFIEDVAARFLLTLIKIGVVIGLCLWAAKRSVETGRLFWIPLALAVLFSIALSFIEQPLADLLYRLFALAGMAA